MNYELAAGYEPVEVTVKDDVVTTVLGPVTVTFQTHRDADAWDDRKEMVDALHTVQAALIEAVDRHKLVHARDQALAVLYAQRHGLTMTKARDCLHLEDTEDELLGLEPEILESVEFARAQARAMLAVELRNHRWSQRGDRIGLAPQTKARALDLNTGEMVTTQQMLRGGFEFRHHEWAWVDANGMEVEDGREGDWWQVTSTVRELPFDPWAAELEYIAGL